MWQVDLIELEAIVAGWWGVGNVGQSFWLGAAYLVDLAPRGRRTGQTYCEIVLAGLESESA